MGCRNCGAPLPDLGGAAMGSCPTCGTLYGERAEIEEYAAAVVTGRPDVERPPALSRLRMNVRFAPATDAGSNPTLTVALKYFGAGRPRVALYAFLALAGFAFVWYQAVKSGVYVVPALVSLPLGFYLWLRFTSLVDTLLVRVTREEIFVRRSRFWPKIQLTVPATQVTQLFTTKRDGLYALRARMRDGSTKLLFQDSSSPYFAWYLECQIERLLGIEDRVDEKELPKNAHLPPRRSRVAAIAVETVILAVLVGAPSVALRACGQSLVEIEVGETPHEASFELDEATRVSFMSEIDLADSSWRYRTDIPRAFTFEIEVLRGGKRVATLSCDPFAVFVWSSTSHNRYINSFRGPMDNCSLKLEAGRYTLRAARSWKPGLPRIPLDESVLEARMD